MPDNGDRRDSRACVGGNGTDPVQVLRTHDVPVYQNPRAFLWYPVSRSTDSGWRFAGPRDALTILPVPSPSILSYGLGLTLRCPRGVERNKHFSFILFFHVPMSEPYSRPFICHRLPKNTTSKQHDTHSHRQTNKQTDRGWIVLYNHQR